MILYHFQTSPYARRVRLVLAHKGLTAELRDARQHPEHMVEVRKLHPLRTVPVLVDEDQVIVDSTAICHYLDRKVPEPPLWPPGAAGAAAFQIAALCDGAMTTIIDLGLHYYPLRDHPNFPSVRAEMLGRAQAAIDALAGLAAAHPPAAPLVPMPGDTWGAADMCLYTLVAWLEGLPGRAPTQPLAAQMLGVGWTLPDALRRWAAPHHQRADVRAL